MTRDPRLIAVSGLGSIARQHIGAFASLGQVDIVAFDPASGLRDAVIDSGLVTRAVVSFDELLACRPDALVIAAPDFAHLDQLARAMGRGIPTLVEKPLSDSYHAARDALADMESHDVPVLVGYVLRYRRAVETVRRLIAEGAIGTAVSFQIMLGAYGTITAAASRFSTPESDRLYRDYSHEWDYLRWIFGPIREVLAVARTTRSVPHVESPNIVDGLIIMQADVAGAFHIDYVEPRGTRTLHIVGSAGSINADIAQGVVTVRRVDEEHERVYRQAEPASVPLARQAAHLLAVADGTEQPRVGLRDGLAALAVTDALIRSAETRSWVSIAADLPSR